jgi:uncharacterized protein YuzE
VPYETARGELLILDFDEERRVIGIELLAPNLKPCQRA